MGKKYIHLDYETYSEANLKLVGNFKYTRHPSFEVLCFAYCLTENPDDTQLWYPGLPIPEDFREAMDDPEYEIAAWNATFEKNVTDICWKQFGLSKAPGVNRYLDVQAIATGYGYPMKLDLAAKAMGSPYLKDSRGTYLINKLTKPKKWSRSTPFTRWTPELTPHEFQEFYAYCKQDVRTEMGIFHRLPTQDITPQIERKVWSHTYVQNNRGVRVDVPLVRQIITVMGQWEATEQQRLIDITGGYIQTAGQLDKIIEYSAKFGVKLPNVQADTIDRAIDHPRVPEELKDVYRIRRNLSKTSTKKFKKMLAMCDKNGIVRGNLIYAPTVTGRYAATGIQIQNLPRKCVKGEEVEIVAGAFMEGLDAVLGYLNTPNGVTWGGSILALASGMIRPSIIPFEGCEHIVTDYSSVENRFLHWLAGDEVTLEDFRKGLDQYKVFASERYGIPYSEVTDAQRHHGKTVILGLGFQMGWKTHQATAKGYGLNLTDEDAKADVTLYRDKYTEVEKLWFNLYKAAIEAVKIGRVTEYSHIRFATRDDRLYMKLPSGRSVIYNSPRVENKMMPWGQTKPCITFMGLNPYSHKWQRLTITPGRLTENAVQAGCRDILVEGLLNVEKTGIYKVIGSTHDEGISNVKIGEGDLEEYNYLMTHVRPWIGNLPLEAKGYRSMRYRKD